MIEINNLTDSKINENFFKKTANNVLRGEKARKISLSIAFVPKKRIKELNKRYRKKNKATDVLSFLYNGLGEIIICPRQVKENAKRFGEGFKKELARVLIHGILHLLGYDHEKSKEEAEIMGEKQNYYLAKLTIQPKDNLTK